MAAGEYIKSAAASLHRAADHLKQQAKEMQSSITRIQADKRTEINKSSLEMKARQVEQAGTSDQGQQSRLSIEIANLQRQIMAAEEELKQAEQRLQNAAAAKINQSMNIENQAKQLESQAGAVD